MRFKTKVKTVSLKGFLREEFKKFRDLKKKPFVWETPNHDKEELVTQAVSNGIRILIDYN